MKQIQDFPIHHIKTFQGHTQKVTGVVFSKNQKTMASWSDDKVIILWNMDTQWQREIPEGAAIDQNSTILAITQQKNIFCWNLQQNDAPKIILSGHYHIPNSLCFSSDSNYLFSGSLDQTVRIWCMEKYQEIACLMSFIMIFSINISDNNKFVAICGNNFNNTQIKFQRLQLWKLNLNKLKIHQNSLQLLYSNEQITFQVVFTPNSKFCLTFRPKFQRFYQIFENKIKLLRKFLLESSSIQSVFSENGQEIITNYQPPQIRVFNTNNNSIISDILAEQLIQKFGFDIKIRLKSSQYVFVSSNNSGQLQCFQIKTNISDSFNENNTKN